MSRQSSKVQHKFNIDTDLNVITGETNLAIAISVVKFLMPFENLLPFRYENFKYYSDTFKQKISEKNEDWNTALVNKEREIVIEISDAIANLFKELKTGFNKGSVNELIVLIGSTVLTPSEAYILKFPDITKHHHSENHEIPSDCLVHCLRQFNQQIVQFNSNKTSKKSLNMFILLKDLQQSEFAHQQGYNERYVSEDVDEMIQKCSKVFFVNLNSKINDENYGNNLNCCNELVVFEDLCNLSVSKETQEYLGKDCLIDSNDKKIDNTKLDWILCKSTIKRYDCKKIRGKLVWEF